MKAQIDWKLRLKRLVVVPALSSALLLAACGGNETVVPGDDALGTDQAQPTVVLATQPAAGEGDDQGAAGTEPAGAGQVTQDAGGAGQATQDTAGAGQATQATAGAGQATQPAAAATQPAANETPATGGAQTTPEVPNTPQAEQGEEDRLVQSSNLIGMDVMGDADEVVGQINDVLVNQAGQVEYIVVELPEGADQQLAAINWDMIQANADLEQLNLSGGAEALADLPMLDTAALQDGNVVLRTQGTDLPEEFNNLIRLSQLANLNLRDQTGSLDLARLEDILVNVNQGQVDFAVLDLSTLLGSEAAIAVPWERLNIDVNAAADAAQMLRLDVNEETLRNAPQIDLSNAPTFINPNETDWGTLLNDFWSNAG